MPASRSRRYFPTTPAWYEVPHATIETRVTARASASVIFRSSSNTTRDVARSARARSASEIARGCSKISFSMKCL
jgi:hypothetical protein